MSAQMIAGRIFLLVSFNILLISSNAIGQGWERYFPRESFAAKYQYSLEQTWAISLKGFYENGYVIGETLKEPHKRAILVSTPDGVQLQILMMGTSRTTYVLIDVTGVSFGKNKIAESVRREIGQWLKKAY